jgi:hypothetical protein
MAWLNQHSAFRHRRDCIEESPNRLCATGTGTVTERGQNGISNPTAIRGRAGFASYSDGMTLKKLLWFALLAFFIFFVVQSPGEAARVVRVTGETLGDWFGAIFQSFTRFLSNLV